MVLRRHNAYGCFVFLNAKCDCRCVNLSSCLFFFVPFLNLARCTIDTAFLYHLVGEAESVCPSLRDVLEHVMGMKLLELHDSVEDAQATLRAALHVLNEGTPPLITRSASSQIHINACSLLIHRIPEGCTEEHIKAMIMKHTSVVPSEVLPITRGKDDPPAAAGGSPPPTAPQAAGRATIVFPSEKHAVLALESIVGPNRPDNSGRIQKRVYMKGGGYVCVRKL